MIRLKKISQSKAFKKLLEALNEDEIEQIEQSIQSTISSEVRNSTVTYNMEKIKLNTEMNQLSKYQGFYDCLINGRLKSNNAEYASNGYFDGVEEAIEYLKNKPDQIIQHLQDPNPVDKIIQHRKDN